MVLATMKHQPKAAIRCRRCSKLWRKRS